MTKQRNAQNIDRSSLASINQSLKALGTDALRKIVEQADPADLNQIWNEVEADNLIRGNGLQHSDRRDRVDYYQGGQKVDSYGVD